MTTSTSPDLASELSLSAQMKQGSLVEHEQAENSTFMSELLGGRINEVGYIAYLQRLRVVYEALEATARELADDDLVSQVYDVALERLATIDADLAEWSHRTGIPLEPISSPAADAYAARLAEITDWGGYVVAHHYTRYLGDLSGGQAIGRLVDRHFDLDGAGISTYAFDLSSAVKPYKDEYRRSLDAIGESLSAADRERIVDEVRTAFLLHHDLFAELSSMMDQYRR